MNAYQARELELKIKNDKIEREYKETVSRIEKDIKLEIENGRKRVSIETTDLEWETVSRVSKLFKKKGFIVSENSNIYDDGCKIMELDIHWGRRTFKNFLRDWILKRQDKKRELDRIRDITRGY